MENEIIAEVRKFRREKRKILHKKKEKVELIEEQEDLVNVNKLS